MTRKRWGMLVLGIPAALAIGWLVYECVSIWATPRPMWVSAGEGTFFTTCEAAAQLQAYDGRRVAANPGVPVSREKALRVAERAIARHEGPFACSSMSYGPHLAELRFPDGERRLAWFLVEVIATEQAGMVGMGDVVFVDAATARPLLLIADVKVGDPAMVCGLNPAVLARSVSRMFAVWVIAGYLLLMAVLAGVVYVWRYVLARRRSGHSSHD